MYDSFFNISYQYDIRGQLLEDQRTVLPMCYAYDAAKKQMKYVLLLLCKDKWKQSESLYMLWNEDCFSLFYMMAKCAEYKIKTFRIGTNLRRHNSVDI